MLQQKEMQHLQKEKWHVQKERKEQQEQKEREQQVQKERKEQHLHHRATPHPQRAEDIRVCMLYAFRLYPPSSPF